MWLALVPGTPPPFRLTSFDFDPRRSHIGRRRNCVFLRHRADEPGCAGARASRRRPMTVIEQQSRPPRRSRSRRSPSRRGAATAASAFRRTPVSTRHGRDDLGDASATTTLTRELTVSATPTATGVKSFFLDPLDVTGRQPVDRNSRARRRCPGRRRAWSRCSAPNTAVGDHAADA